MSSEVFDTPSFEMLVSAAEEFVKGPVFAGDETRGVLAFVAGVEWGVLNRDQLRTVPVIPGSEEGQ